MEPFQLTGILLLFTVHICCAATWTPSEQWGACEPPCGPGMQKRIFKCLETSRYNTTSIRPAAACGGDAGLKAVMSQLPTEEYEQACDWGNCETKSWWRVSNWSDCSQICGNGGFSSRDVECVVSGSAGEITIDGRYADDYCKLTKKPSTTSVCNRHNCPAEFQASAWNKCEQRDPCKPGFQTRQLSCRSLGVDGKYRDLPKAVCFQGNRPPPSMWRRCFLPEMSALCTQEQPEIEEVKMVVVQMKSVNNIRLQVGEEAYILPGTRVVIKCPVKHYPTANIVWKHFRHGEFLYKGRSQADIYVTKSGRLVIRSFTAGDKGEWQCFAGQKNAGIILHYNQPSSGYYEWERRNSMRNTDMLNEDPAVIMTKHVHVQWVEGPWSNCSVACGGPGIQTRAVHCEQVDSGFYRILDDIECRRRLLSKPKTTRVCLNLPKCPSWTFKDADYSVCTNRCEGIGRGTLKGRMACTLGDRDLPDYHCRSVSKPDISCENPDCKVKWEVDNWSACSKPCGGTGYQYRQHRCVWIMSGEPAGSHCYAERLPAPESIRTCTTKPCKMSCVDLSPNCKEKVAWCGFTLMQFKCCQTCREYALQTNRIAV